MICLRPELRSLALWFFWSFVSGDPWIPKAAECAPSRCQETGHCCSLRAGEHICHTRMRWDQTDQSRRRECTCLMGERHHRAPRPRSPILPPTSALCCGNLDYPTCTNTVAVLFFIDPVCCTDCCKYQTLYFSLLIIQYCNIFNIK